MVGAQGVGSQWQAAAASSVLSGVSPPLCPALPPPGKRDQEANLETGKPRDLARRNCSHLSDRKGLSALSQDEGVCRSLG